MYIPASFRVEDEAVLSEFVRAYSFATLVTFDGQQSHATHLPMLLVDSAATGGRLQFHMARANPQWRHLDRADDVLCVFTGPHTYISPSLYAPGNNVPTWNYTAVHVYGRPRVVEDAKELDRMLVNLVENYESPRTERWSDQNSAEYRQQLIQAIVGIELTITRVEGKFKLNQNRAHEIERVIEGLDKSDHPDDQSMAAFMRAYFEP